MITVEQAIQECQKKAANSAAFKYIYEAYSSKMYYVCLRYLKQESDACDILQESFIHIYKKINLYKGTGSFEGWVRRIVIHKCLEFLRKKKSYAELQDIENIETLETFDLEEEIEQNEHLQKILLNAINQLSDGYRTIVNLVLIEGYSHKEVAQMIDITESTSRSQLVRARAKLKKILETGGQTTEKIRSYGRF